MKGMPVTLKLYMQQLQLLPQGPAAGPCCGRSHTPSAGSEDEESEQGSREDVEEEEEGEAGGCFGRAAKRQACQRLPALGLGGMDAGSRRASESGEEFGQRSHHSCSPASSSGAHSFVELHQGEGSPCAASAPSHCALPLLPLPHPALALGLAPLSALDPNNQLQHHHDPKWALPMWLPLQLGPHTSHVSGDSQSPEHSTWVAPGAAAGMPLPQMGMPGQLGIWGLSVADLQDAMGRVQQVAQQQGQQQQQQEVEQAEQADVLAAEIMLALKAVPVQ